ncbi:NAD-dependent epimerase/dehydratase family protein [Bacillus alkalicellulosilyticus]|uniref:NAD-dependent epimerase/dehydratase family protein n=1 Tax=Alkalihalobacterium alkalicellulosilyticum TaxID=1912214 RepID=UPI0009962F63|nr:NAD-dependent epimerase/dehydratase family protein [Bacillus alkalicellulosilyticus]
MKKVLITGVNSYIGLSLENWLTDKLEYQVDFISFKEDSWREKSFSEYDVIFHVAGIAHVSRDPKLESLYYKVNRDYTIESAKKAKSDGVKQFIFMSSIIVYGESMADERIIDINTVPKPSNFYGDSKLQAEEGITPLGNDKFKVAIVRPPMIYGKGSKGNYPKLAKVARMIPIFPEINNQRSMLHIENLCEFIRLLIDNEESGLFFPQNEEYVQTSELVKLIAQVHQKKIITTKMFNKIIKPFIGKVDIINKVFGNLVYDKSLSHYKTNYRIRSLRESIEATEKNQERSLK